MTKSHSKVDASSTQPGPFGGGDPLPTVQAPAPPSAAEAPVKRAGARRWLAPPKAQVEAAPRAADEILAAPDTYTATFGARVPASSTVADSLQYAAGWSSSLAAAEAWRAYCAEQNRLAWTYSHGLLDRLHPIVQAPGSTAAADLPQLTAVVTARTPAAKRAAATRKERAKAAKEAKDAQAPTPTPAPTVNK